MNFTTEQLQELSSFSKQTLEHAQKVLTKDLHAGKSIANLFGYFKGICLKYEKQNNKTGTTKEAAQSHNNARMAMQREEEKFRRTTQNFQPGMPVLTGPHEFATGVKIVETDYEWCLKVEPHLHRMTKEGNKGLQMTRPYIDVMFNRLTKEQQQHIVSTIHTDCLCRPGFVSHNLSKKEAQEVNPEPFISNSLSDPYLSDDSEWIEVLD